MIIVVKEGVPSNGTNSINKKMFLVNVSNNSFSEPYLEISKTIDQIVEKKKAQQKKIESVLIVMFKENYRQKVPPCETTSWCGGWKKIFILISKE